MGVIYALEEEGAHAKAKAYTATLVQTVKEYRGFVYLPYPMLRALLNYKLSAATQQGIYLRLDVGIPAGLTLNESDLAVILGNLLDNAMEACRRLDVAERYLNLRFAYEPDYLIIQTENPVCPTAPPGGKGLSSKAVATDHGFGLRNIEYLVNKHNGLLQLDDSSGIFRVSLALLVEKARLPSAAVTNENL